MPRCKERRARGRFVSKLANAFVWRELRLAGQKIKEAGFELRPGKGGDRWGTRWRSVSSERTAPIVRQSRRGCKQGPDYFDLLGLCPGGWGVALTGTSRTPALAS